VKKSIPILVAALVLPALLAGCLGGKAAKPTLKQDLKTVANNLGMEFVYAPAGTFYMGSPEGEPARYVGESRHKVSLTKGFYIQTTEVTQGQWEAVMGDNPAKFSACGPECPVENVSWEEMMEFIRLVNEREKTTRYRLPTEAEWEYACRAGGKTIFAYGDCLTSEFANFDARWPLPDCSKGNMINRTLPVKSFPPNAWGLYDIHGNVFEACADWYGMYLIDQDESVAGEDTQTVLDKIRTDGKKTNEKKEKKTPDEALEVDPKGPETGDRRVFRGGAWSSDAKFCRSARRSRFPPSPGSYVRGLRLVMDE